MLEWFIKGWFILESEDTLFEEGGRGAALGGVKYLTVTWHMQQHTKIMLKPPPPRKRKRKRKMVRYLMLLSYHPSQVPKAKKAKVP